MRLFAALLILSWVLTAHGAVFFIPGWRTGFHGRDGCVRILRDVYPGKEIIVKSWDSMQPWSVTKRNADDYTKVLISEILAMPESERRNLIIVGHSIGARITVDILNELARRKLQIHSAALLGGALPDDDVRISRALDALRFFCSIVYNPDDWVLKYLFPLDHKLHSPLGLNGWTGQDYRVFESKARSDRFGFCNHFAYIYLEELDRLVEKLPQELPEVSVMQDEADVVRIPADEIFWQTVRRFGNWQLQKSSYNPEKYRILDGRGFRRATGQRVKMTEAFDDVCRQLKFPEK